MVSGKYHYPHFNVMDEKEQWDAHTREIVENRLIQSKYQILSLQESILLTHLCSRILDEPRDAVLHYVVGHFDQQVSASIGEGERKKEIPKASILIREGLRAIEAYCTTHYGAIFAGISHEQQQDVLTFMLNDKIELQADGVTIPAKDLFMKLLTEAVSAYYSHPTIWSEIGYAGPAYPRGYVRSERGLTDPWEARQEDE